MKSSFIVLSALLLLAPACGWRKCCKPVPPVAPCAPVCPAPCATPCATPCNAPAPMNAQAADYKEPDEESVAPAAYDEPEAYQDAPDAYTMDYEEQAPKKPVAKRK